MFITLNNNDREKTENKDRQDSEDVFPDDLPPKTLFRGFEMMPRVLCERFDITPFLTKEKKIKPVFRKIEPIMRGSFKNGDLEKFLRQCSVRLVREDLERLKHCYNKTSNSTRKSILYASTPEKICKICKKAYTSERKLQNHVESKHMIEYKQSKPQKRVSFSDHVIVHEFKEYHRCRKCPKIYEDYNSLKLHMKHMHKKRKWYICFYCNKGFVDRMFFKVHIKLHCSLCGKLFECKKSFNDHKRTVCRIVKKYNCKTCKEVYFSYLSLKDHSYSHDGIIFVCDICKERCKTKCNLLHHIQYLHCRRRPKTLYDTIHDEAGVTYECNSCDHCSNNKQTMVDHTILLPDLKNSKTTGYKDYFFCDQCSEQFDNETEMLRHKWSHFLNTNDKNNDNVEVKDVEKIKMKYKIGEELPPFLKPKIVLDKLILDTKEEAQAVESTNLDFNLTADKNIGNALITKSTENVEHINKVPLIDKGQIESNTNNVALKAPKVSRKTLFSNHQCKLCCKFFSTKYCLRRHMEAKHSAEPDISEDLQCPVCEETFVWKSLLMTHKCIRTHNPDMPFQDARPDIQFDNSHLLMMNANTPGISEDVNVIPDECEIPSPIVELTEYENVSLVISEGSVNMLPSSAKTLSNGYKIVIQEVPIEF